MNLCLVERFQSGVAAVRDTTPERFAGEATWTLLRLKQVRGAWQEY